MQIAFLILNCSLALSYMLFCDRRIIPVLTLLGINLGSAGFSLYERSRSLSDQFGNSGLIFQFLPLSVTFFTTGLLVSQRKTLSATNTYFIDDKTGQDEPESFRSKYTELSLLRFLNFFAILFSSIHFLLVGVVVLQQNVETLRFDSLGASGLFGIPSRAVLFLLPITTATLIYFRNEVSRPELIFTVTFFIGTRYLLGFKGGVWEALIVCFAALFARRSLANLKSLSLLGMGLFFSIALAVNVGNRYSSLSGGLDISYFLRRLVEIPGKDKFYGTLVELQNPETNAFIMDLKYFVGRYFLGGEQNSFAFDKVVSSEISNTERSLDSFLVSVTVGGDVYLASFLPLIIVFFAYGFLGYSIGRSSDSLLGSPRPVFASLIFLVIFNIRIFVQNGGLVYLIVNNLLSVVVPLILVKYWFRLNSQRTSENKR
jgi:hypothetical protein